MKSENDNMTIIDTGRLSDSQIRDVGQLANICCRSDDVRLSYPAEKDGGMDCMDLPANGSGRCDGRLPGNVGSQCDGRLPDALAPRHWLCYGEDGMLQSALALVYYQDSTAECVAFTHPDYRRRGLFSRLLDCALVSCEDCDILFSVSGQCPDTMATLEALGAEPQSTEYQMELELTDAERCDMEPVNMKLIDMKLTGAELVDVPADTAWELVCTGDFNGAESPAHGDTVIRCGSCRTTALSDTCVCLHHVAVLPRFRRQGYGYAMIQKLLRLLCQKGVRRVILQVSGDNEAALALYKKTGFGITETLSSYLY